VPYFHTSDGSRLYYEAYGTDAIQPAIVFLNGTTQTTLHWRPQAHFFRNEYGVVLYDARSQGRSHPGTAPFGLDRHVRDLTALLDHLKLPSVHLVGLSHGAHVALAAAARQDRRVRRVVLCGIGAHPTARMQAILASWIAILKSGGLEAMAWAALPMILGEAYLHQNRRMRSKLVAAVVKRNRKDWLLAHLEAMSTYPSPADAAVSLSDPCLTIAGEQDPMISVAEVKKLAELCRGTHAVIPEAGHTLPIEVPALFNQLVSDFLSAA
jgi:3-oxoadipate enol-lactonase